MTTSAPSSRTNWQRCLLNVLIISVGLASTMCTSTKSKKKRANPRPRPPVAASAEDFSLTLTEPSGPLESLSPDQPIPRKSRSRRACYRLVKRYPKHYRALRQKLSVNVSVDPDTFASRIITVTKSKCRKKRQRYAAIKLILRAINDNPKKVGLLLPLSGPYEAIGQQILIGVKEAFEVNGFDFSDTVHVRDTMGMADTAEQMLAELLFTSEVSMVIGGTRPEERGALAHWGQKLGLPMLMLSDQTDDLVPQKNVFSVFPRQAALAQTLTSTLQQKNLRRVGILSPKTQAHDATAKIVQLLQAQLPHADIEVTHVQPYVRNNYYSMEQAAKRLFQADPAMRRRDYENAIWSAKKKAAAEGVAFNPRMVTLAPIINFDAVFIPDDFKAVRHFVKIFKFLGVPSLPLFGTQSWRSRALIEPAEPFLASSFFADFIGSYDNLPISKFIRTNGSPFFVRARQARNYDYNLIGYHAAYLAHRVIKEVAERQEMAPYLRDMKVLGSNYFENTFAFHPEQATRWPTFVFDVKGSQLQLRPRLPSSPLGDKSAPMPESDLPLFTH